MKIALVSPYDWSFPGGVRQHITDLADYLRGNGHTVDILTAASQPVADPQVHVIGGALPLAINGSLARPGMPLWQLWPRYLALAGEDYDILHLHEPLVAPLTLTCAWYARAADIPCVGTFHAAAAPEAARLYESARPVLRSAFAALDARIAVSPVALDTISRVFPAEYRIIPNGIACASFTRPRVTDADAPTILFLGRLDPRKGLDVLLDAIPLARRLAAEAGDPAPRFIIAGDGPRRAEYQARMRDLPNVTFTGALSEAQKRAYLAQADIFCAPSLGGESQGIVLLEALAAGVAVVASDIPGYRSVITPEKTGVMTPPGDAAELAQALARVARDRALRVRLALAGYIAAQRYDWSQVGSAIEAVYREAIAAHIPARVAGTAMKVYPYATELA